jgi:alpha-glucosidase
MARQCSLRSGGLILLLAPLLYYANVSVRMHYSNDPATLSIDAQFFFGPALLVSPVTEKDSSSVTFYLPNDIFWDLHTLKRVTPTATQTTYSNLSTSDIPVHIKCRNIIPMRVASANTTTALRKQDFELIVAPNGDDKAWGKLYLDDGVRLKQEAVSEIDFTYDGGKLKMDGTFGYDAGVGIKTVTVLGEGDAVKYELNEKLSVAWEHDVKDLEKSN